MATGAGTHSVGPSAPRQRQSRNRSKTPCVPHLLPKTQANVAVNRKNKLRRINIFLFSGHWRPTLPISQPSYDLRSVLQPPSSIPRLCSTKVRSTEPCCRNDTLYVHWNSTCFRQSCRFRIFSAVPLFAIEVLSHPHRLHLT